MLLAAQDLARRGYKDCDGNFKTTLETRAEASGEKCVLYEKRVLGA